MHCTPSSTGCCSVCLGGLCYTLSHARGCVVPQVMGHIAGGGGCIAPRVLQGLSVCVWGAALGPESCRGGVVPQIMQHIAWGWRGGGLHCALSGPGHCRGRERCTVPRVVQGNCVVPQVTQGIAWAAGWGWGELHPKMHSVLQCVYTGGLRCTLSHKGIAGAGGCVALLQGVCWGAGEQRGDPAHGKEPDPAAAWPRRAQDGVMGRGGSCLQTHWHCGAAPVRGREREREGRRGRGKDKKGRTGGGRKDRRMLSARGSHGQQLRGAGCPVDWDPTSPAKV